MKKNTSKILFGVGIAAIATAFVAGVVHELKVIKRLTTDIDELPEDEVPMEGPSEDCAE